MWSRCEAAAEEHGHQVSLEHSGLLNVKAITDIDPKSNGIRIKYQSIFRYQNHVWQTISVLSVTTLIWFPFKERLVKNGILFITLDLVRGPSVSSDQTQSEVTGVQVEIKLQVFYDFVESSLTRVQVTWLYSTFLL